MSTGDGGIGVILNQFWNKEQCDLSKGFTGNVPCSLKWMLEWMGLRKIADLDERVKAFKARS